MDQAAPASETNGLFTGGFSGFAVRDAAAAKRFYNEVLGLDVADNMGGLRLSIPGGDEVFVYEKADHEPANFTIFNLFVGDIAAAVETLAGCGVEFRKYGGEIETDEQGIHWGAKSGRGPNLAWFEDPSGNIFSVVERS